MPQHTSMRLVWLVPNQRWVFLMGESVIHLHNERRSFETRLEAVAAAHRRGLRVDTKGQVQPRNPSNMNGLGVR